jgi:membrane protein DedA with SNARE-associated domain
MDALALISIDAAKAWFDPAGGGGAWWGAALTSFLLLFGCGLGLPMPEDIPLILSGAFLCTDAPTWLIVGFLNWAGIIGGDVCLYFLARRYGMNIRRMPLVGKHITDARLVRVQALFDKYGVGAVAIGRVFAGIRGVMVIVAGTIKFNFWKFFIADSLAAIVSGGLFMLLGYYVGQNLNDAMIKKYQHYFLMGAVVLALVFGAYLFWRWKTHKSVGDVVVEKVETRLPGA